LKEIWRASIHGTSFLGIIVGSTQNESHEGEDPVVKMLDMQLTWSHCAYIYCICTNHTPNKGPSRSYKYGDGKLYSCRLTQLTWVTVWLIYN
jgi:hypothetical protein